MLSDTDLLRPSRARASGGKTSRIPRTRRRCGSVAEPGPARASGEGELVDGGAVSRASKATATAAKGMMASTRTVKEHAALLQRARRTRRISPAKVPTAVEEEEERARKSKRRSPRFARCSHAAISTDHSTQPAFCRCRLSQATMNSIWSGPQIRAVRCVRHRGRRAMSRQGQGRHACATRALARRIIDRHDFIDARK